MVPNVLRSAPRGHAGPPRSRRSVRLLRLLGGTFALLALVLAGCGGPSTPAPPPVAAARPRVLIFGDSYTEGAGAVPVTKGYAYLVGDKLGWDVTVDGVGGTGYLAPGPKKQGTFLVRLRAAPPGPFDIVVLQGSSNDERQPIARLGPAVDATLGAAQARYPDARIVLMGPVPLYGSVPLTKRAVDDTLREHAAKHGLDFLDPVAEVWFTHGESKTMANPTNGHPSNLGHERIRDRFVLDMARLTGAQVK
jgi:acyl-CoA thioesterase-1